MLEPDWNQNLPNAMEATVLWDSVRVVHLAHGYTGEPIENLLAALDQTHANGGAAFAMFSIRGNATFDWFMSRKRWEEISFPEHFLRIDAVSKALPDVCRNPISESFGFEWGSAFTLSGELAQTLCNGGAYIKHGRGAADAFSIAEQFRMWLMGDRFEEFLVLKSHKPWSQYFFDIAWDQTWLLIDKRESKVGVLAITDTD